MFPSQMAGVDSDDSMDSPGMNILQSIIAGKEHTMSKARTYSILMWPNSESQ